MRRLGPSALGFGRLPLPAVSDKERRVRLRTEFSEDVVLRTSYGRIDTGEEVSSEISSRVGGGPCDNFVCGQGSTSAGS